MIHDSGGGNGAHEPAAPRRDALTRLDNLMPEVDELRVYEARIVTNLDAGQALLSDRLGRVYFCDTPEGLIETALARLFTTCNQPLLVESVKIDDKGIFAVAHKLAADDTMLTRICATLRLLGITIRYG